DRARVVQVVVVAGCQNDRTLRRNEGQALNLQVDRSSDDGPRRCAAAPRADTGRGRRRGAISESAAARPSVSSTITIGAHTPPAALRTMANATLSAYT